MSESAKPGISVTCRIWMFQPCSAKWSPVEHACLVLSLKAWLERGSGEGTLELYVFLAF